MKIVFLISSLGSGGAERVATTLCNAWADYGRDVVLITTYSGAGVPFYKVDSKINLRNLADEIRSPRIGKNYFHRMLTLRRMIIEAQPDVVVSFLPNVNIAAIFATAFTGIPCVIGERSDPLVQPLGRLWSTACRMLYRFADAVTVQTDSVAQRIGNVYPALKKVLVIPNPLPNELMKLQPRMPNAASSNGRHILLSVGRLSIEKRTGQIIDAFSELTERYPDWDLHLIGEGPLRHVLQQQINDCGIQPGRIRLIGRSQEPWILMREADAFVLASAYEGFPNALLEAVALGLPSISTDCKSGPREISDNGKVVRLVPVDDHKALVKELDELMGDENLRSQLSREGVDSVRKRFVLAEVLMLWDSLLTSVIAERQVQ